MNCSLVMANWNIQYWRENISVWQMFPPWCALLLHRTVMATACGSDLCLQRIYFVKKTIDWMKSLATGLYCNCFKIRFICRKSSNFYIVCSLTKDGTVYFTWQGHNSIIKTSHVTQTLPCMDIVKIQSIHISIIVQTGISER